MDGWGEEGNLIRKGSVVHALALSAQRFKEKDNKGKQRFHMVGNRSSRRSSQKLGIGASRTFVRHCYRVNIYLLNSRLDEERPSMSRVQFTGRHRGAAGCRPSRSVFPFLVEITTKRTRQQVRKTIITSLDTGFPLLLMITTSFFQ